MSSKSARGLELLRLGDLLSQQYGWANTLGNVCVASSSPILPKSVSKRRRRRDDSSSEMVTAKNITFMQTPTHAVKPLVATSSNTKNPFMASFVMSDDEDEEEEEEKEEELENVTPHLENYKDTRHNVDASAGTSHRAKDLEGEGEKKKATKKKANKPIKDRSLVAIRRFKKEKVQLTEKLFASLNTLGFHDRLPATLSIVWNKKLRTTAGITKLKLSSSSSSSSPSGCGGGPSRSALIELSEKVIDCEERLRLTLLHELCHAAAWLLDGERKPPHGPAFWKWAKTASQRTSLSVTTCHSYEIHKPYHFECVNESCGISYNRHSKKGVDVDRSRCGVCRSQIVFKGAFNADGTPKKQREPSAFSLFVSENFAKVRETHATSSQREIMTHLGALYKKSAAARPSAKVQVIDLASSSPAKALVDTVEDGFEVLNLSKRFEGINV